jgi:hypothetical protein
MNATLLLFLLKTAALISYNASLHHRSVDWTYVYVNLFQLRVLLHPQMTSLQVNIPSQSDQEEIVRLRCMIAQQRTRIRSLKNESCTLKKQLAVQRGSSALVQRLAGTFGTTQLKCLATGQKRARCNTPITLQEGICVSSNICASSPAVYLFCSCMDKQIFSTARRTLSCHPAAPTSNCDRTYHETMRGSQF